MTLLHFNQRSEETSEKVLDLVHAEVDEKGIVTVYDAQSKNGTWYFTLTPEDIALINNAEKV